MADILELSQVTKSYRSAGKSLTVLDEISFTVREGETFSLVGSSGSGKTTLLGLCAGLDQPSGGSIYLNGVRLDQLTEDDRAQVRNQFVGFIFQNFQLLPTLTALENVMVPLELMGKRKVKYQALALLEKVGLEERAHHYPVQLSGGEQQRVAIARAFSNAPKILFADEPTGNLDEETSARVEKLLFDLNAEAGTTLVMVTHDLELAAKTHRTLRLKGGRIAEELTNTPLPVA
ncbi:MAG TPA: ABC transporter [Cytophagales bacterium]|nr:ABC transporter [Cytophagales bacterium]HAA20823.1 ABC transporter [Cytophagales bacterium]HAP59111.1 ABC transporter [Cytophagales bacterium]